MLVKAFLKVLELPLISRYKDDCYTRIAFMLSNEAERAITLWETNRTKNYFSNFQEKQETLRKDSTEEDFEE